MTIDMDETFALALREQMVERVQKSRKPVPWTRLSRPWLVRAGAIVAVATAGGGIAYAAGVFTVPGTDVVTSLAAPVTTGGVGTEVVKLGPAPNRANAIELSLACLTAGDFQFADGAGVDCTAADAARGFQASYTLPIVAGANGTTITATPGARWRLTATYLSATFSAWGINASGQTYGAANTHGTPDLIAVTASNGRYGYVHADQLNSSAPTTPGQATADSNSAPKTLTVYEANGKTAIGTFTTSPTVSVPATTTANSLQP